MNKDQKRFTQVPSTLFYECWGSLGKYKEMAYGLYIYHSMYGLVFLTDASVISINNVVNLLNLSNSPTAKSRRVKELKSTILKLQEDNIIELYSDISFSDTVKFSDSWKLDKPIHMKFTRSIEDKRFFILYDCDVLTLLNSSLDEDLNRLSLLFYYSVIIKNINNKSKLAYPSIDVLSDTSGFSVKTCIKYNNILQDLKLVYFECAGRMSYGNGNHKAHNNTYARYEDRHLVDKYVEGVRVANKDKISNTTKSEKARSNQLTSLKMKIFHAKKKRDKEGLTDKELSRLDELEVAYLKLQLERDRELEDELYK